VEALRPPQDIKEARERIQRMIDRDFNRKSLRERMTVRNIVNTVKSIFQPPTGSSDPLRFIPGKNRK
jgi:hypothetical protein